jgi:hypothetical protein
VKVVKDKRSDGGEKGEDGEENAVVGVVATSSDEVVVTSQLEGTLDEMDSSEILKSSSKD